MKFVAVIAIAAVALVLTATSSTAATAWTAPQHVLGFVPHAGHASGFAPTRQTAKASTPLNCISACSAYESTINQYFTDVAADSGLTTNVYSVATQYSSILYNDTFAGSYVDGNPYPTTSTCQDGFDTYCVTNAQLETEIGKIIARNHWPTFSESTEYFIFTPANVGVCINPGPKSNSNPCTTNVFCAYHSASSNGFIYAVEPDAAAVIDNACNNTGQAPAGNSADDTINTISHEQNESITDPFLNAWFSDDSAHNNPENGDLCAYDFGTPLGTPGTEYNQVINGHNYLLQLEYSNQDTGCVPYLGGPVTAANPVFGSGPLVYHGGDVMTTNTAYAIYWVPAAPVNTKLPTISGTTKVGKKLTASPGTWSNSPKYGYRWLRCSAAGTACKTITAGPKSTYKLVAADKGHKLEVRVTATNVMGSAAKTSAPTAKIR